MPVFTLPPVRLVARRRYRLAGAPGIFFNSHNVWQEEK
jgi:hypothetical protein